MTRGERIGLVAGGSVQQCFVARLPALLAQLGPVSGASYRTARRVSKTLRAGFGVSRYSALEMCPAIWIAAPESSLDRMVRDLAAQTPMHRTMVVLCESMHDSGWLEALRAAGARVASLNAIDESDERAFIAEGHPDTLRALRKLLAQDGRKLIQIGASTKGLYLAAIRMAEDLLLAPVAASVECLKMAGFSHAEAMGVVKVLGVRSLDTYAKLGDKAWSPPARAALEKMLRDLDALGAIHPRPAALFENGARLAQQYFDSKRRETRRRPARSESTPASPLVRAARAGQGRVP